jgi:hypothetical protein
LALDFIWTTLYNNDSTKEKKDNHTMTSKKHLAQDITNDVEHVTCKWLPETSEFRVTLQGLSKEREEAVAYYTDSFEDALGTAWQMAKECQLGKWQSEGLQA